VRSSNNGANMMSLFATKLHVKYHDLNMQSAWKYMVS
jgi:hypothetical protein